MRQQPDLKVICNRSMLSSMHWDQPHAERFGVWQMMLEKLDAVVVMVEPTFDEHRRRIAKAGRSSELKSIIGERRALTGWAHEIEDRGRVVWFQEA